jgi:hypothetical protein
VEPTQSFTPLSIFLIFLYCFTGIKRHFLLHGPCVLCGVLRCQCTMRGITSRHVVHGESDRVLQALVLQIMYGTVPRGVQKCSSSFLKIKQAVIFRVCINTLGT